MINHPNLLLLHPISADDVVNFLGAGLKGEVPRSVR
jgi:hypothetical protein